MFNPFAPRKAKIVKLYTILAFLSVIGLNKMIRMDKYTGKKWAIFFFLQTESKPIVLLLWVQVINFISNDEDC